MDPVRYRNEEPWMRLERTDPVPLRVDTDDRAKVGDGRVIGAILANTVG